MTLTKPLTPALFQRQWGKGLRRLKFDSLIPFPKSTAEFCASAGLPKAIEIHGFLAEFSDTIRPLRFHIDELDAKNAAEGKATYNKNSFPFSWNAFWLLANFDTLGGAGWICIEEASGRIIYLDYECVTPEYIINNSLMEFAECMLHLRDWFDRTKGDLKKSKCLIDLCRMAHLPCFSQNNSRNFWIRTLEDDIFNSDYQPNDETYPDRYTFRVESW